MERKEKKGKSQEVCSLEKSISGDLQKFERLVKEENVTKTTVNLPTGVFRKAFKIREELYFVNNNTLCSRQIESRIKQCIFALKNHPREIKYNVERGREKRCLYNGKS